MIWKNEITTGDVVVSLLAIAALVLAMCQLVKSRQDLINERRADFRLGQLASIAVTLESGSSSGDPTVAARLRFLPPEWDMPVLRAWSRVALSPAGLQEVEDLYKQMNGTGSLLDWIREHGRAEIAAATAEVLEEVPLPARGRR